MKKLARIKLFPRKKNDITLNGLIKPGRNDVLGGGEVTNQRED